MNAVFAKIRCLLDSDDIEYNIVRHEPTYTSEESAMVRREPLANGAKALLIKGDEDFYLFVISAVDKLDSKKAKALLGVRSLRFATKEELLKLTGLYPGSLPPFGLPVLPVKDFFVDKIFVTRERIAFNAGSLEISIKMNAVDYLKTINKKTNALV